MGLLGFRKNIILKPYQGMSPWRKITCATWNTASEGSIYGTSDFDAAGIIKVMEHYKSKGIKVTPTMVISKAVADAMAEFPEFNTVSRFGKIYHRKNVDVFISVSGEKMGDDLSGVIIRNCDEKNLEEISVEIKEKVERVKDGSKDGFKQSKNIMNLLPPFVVKIVLKLITSTMYLFNIWHPILGTPRDSMGSVVVTSLGMFGIDVAYAPLIPYTRCPVIFAIGKIAEKPIVENFEITIKPMITMNITFDHRLVDGRSGGKLLQFMTNYFADLNQKDHA